MEACGEVELGPAEFEHFYPEPPSEPRVPITNDGPGYALVLYIIFYKSSCSFFCSTVSRGWGEDGIELMSSTTLTRWYILPLLSQWTDS